MAKAKIMIVEDDRIVAEDIQDSLKKMGYTVSAIVSFGKEAIKRAKEDSPDLVLMDIVLSGEMNGTEAAYLIRSQFNIPIVYLTAYADEEVMEKAKITEPYGYIIKPFEDRELKITIEIALYKHGMEKKIKESEAWYSTTLKSIGDAVISTDTKGYVTFMNPVAESLTGWSRDEAIGKPLNQVFLIINEKTRERCDNPVEKVIVSGLIEGLTNDTILISKDGEEHVISDSGAPIFDSDRNIIGVILVFRDVTEKIALQKQIIQSQKIEALGTLAGGIAHDFNNLLMGILGRTALMMADIDSSNPHFEHLKGIEDYVKSATDLTKQLLGFGMGGKYEVTPTDLNETLNKCSKMFGRTKKEVKIHVKYEQNLWITEVDKGQIEQVLLNIYVNAWQAMPGGGDLYIQTQNVNLDEHYTKPFKASPGEYVKISVTDTGVGMDEITRQRIFDPFFTTKEMGRGTGLGLASVYGIVKNHEGFINVNSEKGEGATFNIYFPATEKKAVVKKELERDELKGSETVLLVDDEDMIIDVGQPMLEKMGYNVLIAKGGKEALEIYQKNEQEIDMVILDLIMPDIGGGETYDRLNEINPEIKVLLSSGYSIDGQAREILERGCHGFIQKPFNMKDLSQKIREILDKD
jgi:PAS domain S-box-containing protein